jgi:hypothetical protein
MTSIAPAWSQGSFRPVPVSQTSPVANTFAAYPGGGPALREGIKNLVLKDPTLAAEVVRYLKTANLSQAEREATEQGLADALNLLLLRGEDQPGGGINPTVAALVVVLAGGAGVGTYFLTQKSSNSVSPN